MTVRPLRQKAAGVLVNVALVLASCLAVLLVAEAGLRFVGFVHPPAAWRYDIVQRDPGRRHMLWHPDTGERHAYFLNNLGLRQHRDFTAESLESSVNIGVFGDSFTDNIELPAEFSFTEPLDYLLNIEREPTGATERPRFNVLNFAHSGWGTAQSLLRYEALGGGYRGRGRLDRVFYVFTHNDLSDNIRHGLFRVGDSGRLERVEVGRVAAFASATLSKLRLSYLALGAIARLQVTKAGGHRPGAFDLFRSLLRRFKEAVEANGASFHLVLLPRMELPEVAAVAAEEGVASVHLWDCFAEHDPSHPQTPWAQSPYRFKNNWHWNEAGNRMAALCLHRFLERELELPPLSEAAVERALSRYYAAFETPLDQSADPGAAGAIRARYAALVEREARVMRALPAPKTEQLIVRSTFDVYLQDGWLAYVKPGCDRADFNATFFLHVVPADAADLPSDRLAHGFDNLDFWGYPHTSCTVWTRLPGYPMERISTGQYRGAGDGVHDVLWQGEHVVAEGGLSHASELP